MSKRGFGRLGTRAVELGFATEAQVVDAHAFRQLARIENGLDIGLDEALLWQGAITLGQLEQLRAEVGGDSEHGYDRVGKLQFGTLALTLGFVTEEQLREALAQQAREGAAGQKRRLVGEILYANGAIDREKVETVVKVLVEEGYGETTRRRLAEQRVPPGSRPSARYERRGRIEPGGFEL